MKISKMAIFMERQDRITTNDTTTEIKTRINYNTAY